MYYLSFKKIIRFVMYVSVAFIISIVFNNVGNAQYFGYYPYMYGGGLMQPYDMYGTGYGNPYGYSGYGMYSGYSMYGTG
jgi:hypothetical protein